jgi:hypothetical protein
MRVFKDICVGLALLAALLAASVPAKRFLSATQRTVQREMLNAPLVQRTASVVFLGRRLAASQYYQLLAMLYLARMDYPHYHGLIGGDDGPDADGNDHHDHAHRGPSCNAAGERYVAFAHGPGGDVPLTARDVDALNTRARYIDAHTEEFIDVAYFYSLLGLSNALDPDNDYVLEFGRGWILNRRMAECLVKELTAAYARKPGWRSMFEAGWVTLYQLRDYETARRYLRTAAREPGAPPFVAGIYASSFYADRKYAAAIEQLALEIEATSDHRLRTRLEQRLVWYHNLLVMNRAAQTYREHTGREVGRLDELVVAGLIESVPADSCGGGFAWDAARHEVVSQDTNAVLER